MAARKDQPQPFILEHGFFRHVGDLLGQRVQACQFVALRFQQSAPPQQIHRFVSSRRNQPCTRVRGRTGFRPSRQRRRERLLHRVLGEIQIAEKADQRGENPSRLLAINLLDVQCSAFA